MIIAASGSLARIIPGASEPQKNPKFEAQPDRRSPCNGVNPCCDYSIDSTDRMMLRLGMVHILACAFGYCAFLRDRGMTAPTGNAVKHFCSRMRENSDVFGMAQKSHDFSYH